MKQITFPKHSGQVHYWWVMLFQTDNQDSKLTLITEQTIFSAENLTIKVPFHIPKSWYDYSKLISYGMERRNFPWKLSKALSNLIRSSQHKSNRVKAKGTRRWTIFWFCIIFVFVKFNHFHWFSRLSITSEWSNKKYSKTSRDVRSYWILDNWLCSEWTWPISAILHIPSPPSLFTLTDNYLP